MSRRESTQTILTLSARTSLLREPMPYGSLRNEALDITNVHTFRWVRTRSGSLPHALCMAHPCHARGQGTRNVC